MNLLRPTEENAAQHEPQHAFGMRFGVSQRERRTPRAAEQQPALDAQVCAQPLDVGDELGRRVIAQFPQRRRLAGTALVVDDDPVVRRIVEAPVVGRAAAAGTSVQEDDGHAARIARLLPVHRVQGVELPAARSGSRPAPDRGTRRATARAGRRCRSRSCRLASLFERDDLLALLAEALRCPG